MSGLVLKLGPKERILINGAVIENGDRRSRLSIVTPNANILRLRDAIHPEEANTPVRRVCYIAQLVLSGDADPVEGAQQLTRGIDQLSQALTDNVCRGHLDDARRATADAQYYQALKSLRQLLAMEEAMLDAAQYN